MAKRGRPKRSNPQAERKIFKAELESCPACNERLTSIGNAAHSKKTVQTLKGEFHVVAYSRLCDTPGCEKEGHHYHGVGHLQIALPGESNAWYSRYNRPTLLSFIATPCSFNFFFISPP